MINPNNIGEIAPEDELSKFAHFYLNSDLPGKIYTPIKNGLIFEGGMTGIVLYRHEQFQVELFIVKPNLIIPEHTHPHIDSYECFLYGMKFTHSGKTAITHEQAFKEQNGYPINAYKTIRVKPNDLHGGTASKTGGAFISIQHWLNGVEPTHVNASWAGSDEYSYIEKEQN
jgi:hypothetical protein